MRFSVLVGVASDMLGEEITAIWRGDAISDVSQQQWHTSFGPFEFRLHIGRLCRDTARLFFFFFLSRIHITHIIFTHIYTYWQQIRWDNLPGPAVVLFSATQSFWKLWSKPRRPQDRSTPTGMSQCSWTLLAERVQHAAPESSSEPVSGRRRDETSPASPTASTGSWRERAAICRLHRPLPSHAAWTGAASKWTHERWLTLRCWIRQHHMDWIKEERQVAGLKTDAECTWYLDVIKIQPFRRR